MTIETVERTELIVVGMAISTRPLSPDIPALWPRFVERMDEINHPLEPRVSYGVMRHEPPDSLDYLAGVSVRFGDSIPKGLETRVIPAGTYARFRYPRSRLGEGFGEIFGRLLPSSGHVQIAGLPLFERYDEAFDPGDPDSLVEIGIPVRRQA